LTLLSQPCSIRRTTVSRKEPCVDTEATFVIGDRVGSLEPGKDADVVLYDGDPFEYTSHVTAVLVNGKLSYQRE